MSTAIAESVQFSGLRAENSIIEMLSANLPGGTIRAQDLTTVRIPPQGSTTWSWSSKSGTEYSEKVIRGLLVVVAPEEQTLWPYRDPKPGSRPLMVATSESPGRAWLVGDDFGELDRDLIEAAKLEDGTYDIAKIEYFQWQENRVPPRAKASRVIGILRENDLLPVFIRASSTSLKNVNDFLKGLLFSDGLPHWRAVVEATLERRSGRGPDYSVLCLSRKGHPAISREDGVIAKERFTDVFTPIVAPHPSTRGVIAGKVSTDRIPF
jgi:hypothetical protein